MCWLLCWLTAGCVMADFRFCCFCAGCCVGRVLVAVLVVCWLISGGTVPVLVAVLVDCWLCHG